NSAGQLMDDPSDTDNCNYNFVKLHAVGKGEATVSVTVTDQQGSLGSVTETFTVQVIDPEYDGTQRTVIDFSQGWKFQMQQDMPTKPEAGQVPTVDGNGEWDDVSIPHCWNADDGANGGNDYVKGIGWYIKTFTDEEVSALLQGGKHIYLDVGAACKISETYVNGQHVGRHEGGYSRFRYDITQYLNQEGENTVAISVDNNVNNLTPMSGDFTVFGGLYRDISLVAVGDVHMDLDQETA
ncbi:sugar-binding domain-containing protein, partial [Flavonifractor hominis]